MRRLTAGGVLAAATGAGLVGKCVFGFIASVPAHGVRVRRWWSNAQTEASIPRGQQQDDGHGGEQYGKDDQRRFWDTVMKVLDSELGGGDQLSRVWEFVRHNREGEAPPFESPHFRATGLYFPGLEAKPWWDRSEFSWLQELEDAAPDITLEMQALVQAGGGAPFRSGSGEMSTVYDATEGWGTMRLRYMGRYGQPGINYALLPRTLAALRRLPLAPETAAFQRQLPGTGLPLHVDPSNFVLGCHLGVVIPSPSGGTGRGGPGRDDSGLRASGGRFRRNAKRGGGFGFGAAVRSTSSSTEPSNEHRRPRKEVTEAAGNAGGALATGGPGAANGRKDGGDSGSRGNGGEVRDEQVGSEGAWIEVACEKKHWQKGRAFVFDPSFLHRTHNPTSGERVILNLDVWHPGLEEIERTAIRRVCELAESWNEGSGLFQDD